MGDYQKKAKNNGFLNKKEGKNGEYYSGTTPEGDNFTVFPNKDGTFKVSKLNEDTGNNDIYLPKRNKSGNGFNFICDKHFFFLFQGESAHGPWLQIKKGMEVKEDGEAKETTYETKKKFGK